MIIKRYETSRKRRNMDKKTSPLMRLMQRLMTKYRDEKRETDNNLLYQLYIRQMNKETQPPFFPLLSPSLPLNILCFSPQIYKIEEGSYEEKWRRNRRGHNNKKITLITV